ncbi:recombinase family protein [Streptomyces sp. NPDC053048]|uniref:recombinase family protein n=1 Tax=Streptomyces sp. NPDC053048 TaxID=3365694 RepID=UPI0037CFAC83
MASKTQERILAALNPEWTDAELTELRLHEVRQASLPDNAPRAIISVRLSLLTEDSTSPARQELDQRGECDKRGWRVVEVVKDLNVSASKLAPWKRKALTPWLTDRLPEYDILMFWKLDRLIRRRQDLTYMIKWAEDHDKKLVSFSEPKLMDMAGTGDPILDLINEAIREFMALMANIEAANTSKRVGAAYRHHQVNSDRNQGQPVFGYDSVRGEDGIPRRVLNERETAAVRWAARRRIEGVGPTRLVKTLRRAGFTGKSGGTLTETSLRFILRNPALTGHRTRVKPGTRHDMEYVLNADGEKIKIAEAVLEEDLFKKLQEVMDSQSKPKQKFEYRSTLFRDSLICPDCNRSIVAARFRKLAADGNPKPTLVRCTGCKGKPMPHAEEIYSEVVRQILEKIGGYEVEERIYYKADKIREEAKLLHEQVSYYVSGLEPGGLLTRTEPIKLMSEERLKTLMMKLENLPPEALKDRWEVRGTGRSYAEEYKKRGVEGLEEALERGGVKIHLHREYGADRSEKIIRMKVLIPKDIRSRLVIKPNPFEGFPS